MSEISGQVETSLSLREYVRQEFVALKSFVLNPRRGRPQNISRRGYWKRLLFLFVLDLSAGFSLLFFFHQFSSFDDLEYGPDLSKLGVAIFAVFIGPPIEECIFRLGLRNFRYSLLIGPAIVAAFLGSWEVLLALVLVLSLEAAYLQFKLSRSAQQNLGFRFHIRRQFIQSYKWVFWLWAIAFSLVHITNYEINKPSDWVVIFAVLPQLFGGIILGYVRLRMNTGAAIVLHMAANASALAILMALP
ncbi:CPBP family glutamic-type intramembrane protease [Undibacterium cyanobacteriorum]|uniref:CPBP family glutamic-type intramembrane protease n=1 Tax=Undibacterium cyanobacteriorum TaxID=3073561 RepID=A0ABY9RGY7_9BURK|nr:CPBP family glutamic-type intramembrane protease [Undibacterium sp. 20NA77.5]WMW80497.1 CPBP family glutamic-type intramembrane protease [Undibacterium sp. 20NA77.5]